MPPLLGVVLTSGGSFGKRALHSLAVILLREKSGKNAFSMKETDVLKKMNGKRLHLVLFAPFIIVCYNKLAAGSGKIWNAKACFAVCTEP